MSVALYETMKLRETQRELYQQNVLDPRAA